MSGPSCYAVLPAAGIGTRMGGETPKQYLTLGDKTLLEHSLRALLDCPQIARVVVPLHPEDEWANDIRLLSDDRVEMAIGGAERCDSVLAGLQALAAEGKDGDWVLVHDAARPCLQARDVERLIDTVLETAVGGILAERIVDTVKQADPGGRVEATLDRSRLWRAQTPQMFRLGELRDALISARDGGYKVTDEASAMEQAGFPVQLVPGSSSNLKVTVPEDIPLAQWYLERAAATAGGNQ